MVVVGAVEGEDDEDDIPFSCDDIWLGTLCECLVPMVWGGL